MRRPRLPLRNRWKKSTRTPKKPVFDKDGKPVTEEKEIKIPAFRVVSVFDISQTEGKELPALTYELTGNVEQYKDFSLPLKRLLPLLWDLKH